MAVIKVEPEVVTLQAELTRLREENAKLREALEALIKEFDYHFKAVHALIRWRPVLAPHSKGASE